MANLLKKHFPMIRERGEVLQDIWKSEELQMIFVGWTKEHQEEFLDFCTGVRGVKLLYDSFFKEIMNPESDVSRINDFLSALLQQKVKVLHVLPNDSVRIASEGTLLITDLVVEFEDGSVANIEVQKIGYLFPGERAACYSADLLLRQYKRVRGEKKDTFTYRDIKPVYTIVLFEKSPAIFHKFPDDYIHHAEARSDTGIRLKLLQKYVFIPLDIFRERVHNKGIENRLDAWLSFFCMDAPEDVVKLITAYPEFGLMYEDAYELCRSTERMMNMFSKELLELDRNTAAYMVDVMQKEIDEQKQELDEQRQAFNEQRLELDTAHERIAEAEKREQAAHERIDEQKQELDVAHEQIDEQKQELDTAHKRIAELEAMLGVTK